MAASSTGSFNQFYRRSLFIVLLLTTALPLWNVIVNPYQVLPSPFAVIPFGYSPVTNERYLKLEYLLNTGEDSGQFSPDAYVVGSSVMGLIDPKLAEPHFPGTHFYNLAFLAAKPGEILATLKALKQAGRPLRRILYGLEPIGFTDRDNHGPAYRLHPLAAGENQWRSLWNYGFAPSVSDGIAALSEPVNGQWPVRYDIRGSGRYFLPRFDKTIKSDPETFRREHFPPTGQSLPAPPWLPERFDEFARLVQWCREQNIAINVYFNPLHPYLANAYGNSRLTEFRQHIARAMAPDLPSDCSGLFPESSADSQFYDARHFLPSVADSVLDCALASAKSN